MKTFNSLKYRLLIGFVVVFALFTLLTSCNKTSVGPASNEVWIEKLAFNPSLITVTTGSTIIWVNRDMMSHDITSTSGLFKSESLPSEATFSHKFTTTGTYPYSCSHHPAMSGIVLVKTRD